MGEESEKTVVNSWNEWDPLKHIIVGRADGTMVQAPEPAIQREWLERGFPLGTYGPYPREMEEGRTFNQWDDEEFEELLRLGGHEDKCTSVVGNVARWTTDILTDQ